MKTIGDFLRQCRINRRLKATELAEYLNVAQSTYSQYENDNIALINPAFFKLAEFYNRHPADFFREAIGGTDKDFPYLVSESPPQYMDTVNQLKQELENKIKEIGILEYRLSKYEPVDDKKDPKQYKP